MREVEGMTQVGVEVNEYALTSNLLLHYATSPLMKLQERLVWSLDPSVTLGTLDCFEEKQNKV